MKIKLCLFEPIYNFKGNMNGYTYDSTDFLVNNSVAPYSGNTHICMHTCWMRNLGMFWLFTSHDCPLIDYFLTMFIWLGKPNCFTEIGAYQTDSEPTQTWRSICLSQSFGLSKLELLWLTVINVCATINIHKLLKHSIETYFCWHECPQ